jgi:hypothetical protein
MNLAHIRSADEAAITRKVCRFHSNCSLRTRDLVSRNRYVHRSAAVLQQPVTVLDHSFPPQSLDRFLGSGHVFCPDVLLQQFVSLTGESGHAAMGFGVFRQRQPIDVLVHQGGCQKRRAHAGGVARYRD